MLVQGHHIDNVNFGIRHFFQFDLSLTFDPLSVGRTKRSPWTLLHVCPTLTHWSFNFCHLTHFVICLFFDLWPFNRWSDKEVTVDTYACLPNTNTLTLLLLSFDTFCNLTFFEIWPLIRRSDKEVTVNTFASSSKTNTLTLSLLSFETFCNLTFLWPFFDLWLLNRRSEEEVTVDTYACLPNTNTLTLLLLSFDTFCNLTFLWPLTP